MVCWNTDRDGTDIYLNLKKLSLPKGTQGDEFPKKDSSKQRRYKVLFFKDRFFILK
jgi:hypothetical protein